VYDCCPDGIHCCPRGFSCCVVGGAARCCSPGASLSGLNGSSTVDASIPAFRKR
jgi:hypothetical protein